ncbi:type II CAAX prenyl endopeptidase Rce1 family protein, partial [Enterococcus lactis]|uniref:CPBP family glutamic-type intramembrane protease n=1 Tax=Enterococcus lactis TaxID=357441 RepID=UPI00390827F9
FIRLFKDSHFSKKLIVYTIEMTVVVVLFMLMSGTPNGSIYQKLVHRTSFTDVRLQYFFIIISVILAPIVEEFYFRGLIFTYVKKTTNLTT